LNFLQLPKSQQFDGPIQIESKISQDQTISKDLTLWNQQGSQVLRGQMLVLPIAKTLLYIEPIYIQASQSPMPQLKKIAMYAGGRLIYTDTYEQAVAELAGFKSSQPAAAATATPGAPKPAAVQQSQADALAEVRDHLRKYRELMSQGKYADAGKEIEALERLATRH
jgi:uncharacterized membrane protein (UPF0182 family)